MLSHDYPLTRNLLWKDWEWAKLQGLDILLRPQVLRNVTGSD